MADDQRVQGDNSGGEGCKNCRAQNSVITVCVKCDMIV